MSALIVNFFGGPGISKSTMAAHVFAELKWAGINCELATEYAKEKVWEGSFNVLKNQRLVYGKQHHMIWRSAEQVDVIVTDCPLLLSAIYSAPEDTFLRHLIVEDFKKFNNLNFLLTRQKAYVSAGRMQNKEEAIQKDIEIRDMLIENKIVYLNVPGARDSVQYIVDVVLDYREKHVCSTK
jgi:hypothetical protein